MPPLKIDDTDIRVARARMAAAFAKTAKPTCEGVPAWPRFEPGNGPRWMVFDAYPTARPLPETAALDLLQCRLAVGLPLVSGTCLRQ